MPRDYRDMNRNFGGSRSVKILVSVLAFALLALSACEKDVEGEKVMSEELAEFLAGETGVEVAAGAKYKGKLDSERDKCCSPVSAKRPVLPVTKALCLGLVWDDVFPFSCFIKKNSFCVFEFDTLVTLQQYRYQWDANAEPPVCTLVPTGREKDLEKKTCRGSGC